MGTIFVDQDATGAKNGSSWADAYTDLQLALEDPKLISGYEIWVAAGTYIPGNSTEDSFVLVEGVKIYGGFAGDESARDDRDWMENATVLSGAINDSTNCTHVVIGRGLSSKTILDGFTISGGGKHESFEVGGGLYLDGAENNKPCNPILKNLIFSENHAYSGGAIYSEGKNGECSPTLTNITFKNNSADRFGGALYHNGERGKSNPILTDVTFSRNIAGDDGGAMYNNANNKGECNPTLTNVTFIENHANGERRGGGAIKNLGWYDGSCYLRLDHVTFSGNTARYWGGALYNDVLQGECRLELTDVAFMDNSADVRGGAIYSNASGGPCNLTFNSVVFSGNNSKGDAGALYSEASKFGPQGTCHSTFTNVTFYKNSAEKGGILSNRSSRQTFTNVIFWNNTAGSGGLIDNQKSSMNVSYSIVQGGVEGISGVEDDGNNLDQDPLIVESADSTTPPMNRLSLALGSPALGAGKDGANIGAYQGAGTDVADSTASMITPEIMSGDSELRFVWCKVFGGTFKMGSEEGADDEKPSQEVQLNDYWIMRFPVTQHQFRQFIEEGSYVDEQWWGEGGLIHLDPTKLVQDTDNYGEMAQRPMERVNWYEAMAFCRWASSKAGYEIRLPTEAEWEKAARGTDGRKYPWGNNPPTAELCNFGANVMHATNVGRYSPQGDSPFGCTDMAGNVLEWCLSKYAAYPYNASDGREELQGEDERVLRGGSWDELEPNVRTAQRHSLPPQIHESEPGAIDMSGNLWGEGIGFRCVSTSLERV